MNVAIITAYAEKILASRPELVSSIQKTGACLYVMGPEPDELAAPILTRHNIIYVQLPLTRRNVNPFKELQSLNKISVVFIKNKIDCLLVYGVRMFPSVVLAARKAGVKRVVCVVNGAGNLFMLSGVKGFLARRMGFPMLRRAFAKADAVIFQNNDDYAEMKSLRLVDVNTNVGFTNGSGVNLERFSRTPLPDNHVVLIVTRLAPGKGIDEFVAAARIVNKKHPEAKFKIVGPKDTNAGIDWVALNAAERDGIIEYQGESDNIFQHLSSCRIFAFPSYYREGVPRCVLEAMAIGRPIITTDVQGCRETVEDSVNGFLLPPRDVDALSERILWLLSNPEQAATMGEASRRYAELKFDIHKVNAHIIEALKLKN